MARDQRDLAALRRVGVTALEVARQPQITPVLTRVLGSAHKVVDALRFSSEKAALDFLIAWDEIPSGDREYLTLEAICIKAEVNPAHLLGAAIMSSKAINAQESALLAMTEHPSVLKRTIQVAKTKDGFRDRKMLHESVGFLPTSKGMALNVNLLNGQPQFKEDDADSEDGDDGFQDAFPSVNTKLNGWADSRRKMLEAKVD